MTTLLVEGATGTDGYLGTMGNWVGALELTPCSFLKFPTEIQINILTLVEGLNNKEMLALTRVCQLWQEIILDIPSFWRKLVLSRSATPEKVEIWIERSRGTLHELYIDEETSDVPKTRRDILQRISWSDLRSLRIRNWRGYAETRFLSDVRGQLHLRSLDLCMHTRLNNFLSFDDMDTSGLQSLTLEVRNGVVVVMPSAKITSLVYLELSGSFRHRNLYEHLGHNRCIETLILKPSYTRGTIPTVPPDAEDIIPDNLRHP